MQVGCVLILLFGLVVAEKPVPRYGVTSPSTPYTAPQLQSYGSVVYHAQPVYVQTKPSKADKFEAFKAKISSKKEDIKVKLDDLKAKIIVGKVALKSSIADKFEAFKAKISSKKEDIKVKLDDLKAKIIVGKVALKSKFENLKSKISSKVSAFKSKLESKKATHVHEPKYSAPRPIVTYVSVPRPTVTYARPQHRW